jgi:hypothetical protein
MGYMIHNHLTGDFLDTRRYVTEKEAAAALKLALKTDMYKYSSSWVVKKLMPRR